MTPPAFLRGTVLAGFAGPAAIAIAAAVTGCAGKGKTGMPGSAAAAPPVRRATDVDPALADPAYHLAQPAVATVRHGDFTALWDAAEEVARTRLFAIDRRDYRGGRLTTQPMVSKQWFELWRRDAGTGSDVAEASLGPVRRTIHFEFAQDPAAAGGAYGVSPKVLVERQAVVEGRYVPELGERPGVYWYALRRDHAMEQDLAAALRARLNIADVATP